MPMQDKIHYEEEEVEDSEPEREAQRLVLRTSSKLPQGKMKSTEDKLAKVYSGTICSQNVIDLSEYNTSRGAPNRATLDSSASSTVESTKRRSIIEISDSSMESSGSLCQTNGADKPMSLYSRNTSVQVDPGEWESDDETFPSLRLTRFAFTSERSAVPSKVGQPKAAHHITTRPPPQALAKASTLKKAGAVSTQCFGNFSDAEISLLLKCICCDVRWTARKSTAQKVAHIKSCAKKSLLKEDTIVALIRKELTNTTALQSKGKSNNLPEAPASAATLLNEVVQHAAPKKKTRREVVSGTVRDVEANRNAILERAKFIVAQGDSTIRAMRERNTTTTVGFNQSSLLDDIPFSTPGFSKSALARRVGSKAKALFHDPDDSTPDMDEPSVDLGIAAPIHADPPQGSVLKDSDVSTVQTVRSQQPNLLTQQNPSDTFLVYTPSSSNEASANLAKDKALSSSPSIRSRRKPSSPISSPPRVPSPSPNPDNVADLDLWGSRDADDAFLHHDSENDNSSLESEYPDQPTIPNLPGKLVYPPLGTTPIRSPIHASASTPNKSATLISTSTTRPRKRTSKKARGIRQARSTFDDEWEQGLKDKILNDTALHLSILRFEPISFKVFLAMAHDGDSKPSGKLKSHLQAFLDKQAVNFYDVDPSGRRRR